MFDQTLPRLQTAPKPVFQCTLCGAVMYEIRCKLICVNCGYTRDCSDP